MKVKFGHNGKIIELPGHINISNYDHMTASDGGVCIHPDNIREELFLRELVDILGKHTIFEIEQALNKLE